MHTHNKPQIGKEEVLGGHSANFLEMSSRSEKRKRISGADGYGQKTGQCGETVEIFLIVRGQRIFTSSFDTDGCSNIVACANTVLSLIENKTISQAWEVSVENVSDYLETLPAPEIHCAELAVGALYLALTNYQKNKNAPWKKWYQS